MSGLNVELIRGTLWRFRRLLLIAGLLVAVYAAVGFLLVPYVARRAIENYVTQDLKRHVTIGKITFNPFTLAAEVRGFALTESNNSPIASFDLFRIDLQISSIVFRAWTFKEIRLDRPDIQALIDADGSLNLARLRETPSKPAPPSGPVQVPALRIATLGVHNGSIRFEDHNRTRSAPFRATLTPIEFTLTNFRTEPNFQNAYNFQGSTLAGERLGWSGQFSVQPPGSSGRFQVSNLKSSTIAAYLGNALGFDLRSGILDLTGDYRIALEDQIHMAVNLPTLRLREVEIAPSKTQADPWVVLPLVEVSNSSFSLEDHKARIERVQIDRAKLNVWRDTDGSINLQRLFFGDPPETPPVAAPAAAVPAPPGWALSIGTIAVTAASIDAEDRMIAAPVKLSLAPVSATISDYSNAPGNVIRADIDITAGAKGRVTAQGDFALTPWKSNFTVNVSDFELPPLQPYFIGSRPLQLTSGQVSLKGLLQMSSTPAKGTSPLSFTGDLAIANIAARDTASRMDIIRWQLLQIAGIHYSQSPDTLDIERIEARKPYGRVIISPDERLNITTIMNTSGPVEPVLNPGPKSVPAPKAPAPEMRTLIRTVVVHDGSSDFTDFSVEPNFSTAIFGLEGAVSGLSSDLSSRAEVKLAGNVDRYAPVDISGTVNLLSAAVFSDVSMKFRNMELTTFNPYSGKYAGYSIRKGKLTTELKYRVENRKLDAQHHIVLDQLEFGDATDSKAKVSLPIRLAAALLKDRQGVIDINLPVTGSLDDPEFRIAPLVWKALRGLLDRIVTAPFKLLGALFGKGDELAYIDFTAGSSAIPDGERKKITTLAKALVERPQIRLDVPLQALTPADDAALARAAFDAALAPLLPQAAPGVPATKEQRVAALAQLYQQQLGTVPVYPAPAADDDVVSVNMKFLEDALRPQFDVTPSQRDQLARARADAVQAAVLANTQVTPERVFLTERESGKTAIPETVRMELKLE